MTDIVEQLRVWAEDDLRAMIRDQRRLGLKIDESDGERWAGLMEKAADAIERLRSALREIEAHADEAPPSAADAFIVAIQDAAREALAQPSD